MEQTHLLKLKLKKWKLEQRLLNIDDGGSQLQKSLLLLPEVKEDTAKAIYRLITIQLSFYTIDYQNCIMPYEEKKKINNTKSFRK
jgi:hypothetical protein